MKNKWLYIIILLLIFRYAIHPPLDLDLGWHLRYGEYFFKTGQVLRDNILSFVWPNYKWVQASWGFDLLIYQIYTHFGFLGTSLAAAITTTIIFAIITAPFTRLTIAQFLFLAYLFIAHSEPLYSAGFRSQTPSTLLFAIILVIAVKALEGSKKLSWNRLSWAHTLPLLFLVWANLHGGFALGLILLLIYWAGHGALLFIKNRTKRNVTPVIPGNWLLIGAFLFISIATPLINPWGAQIYEETFRHTTNTNLTAIVEWMPMTQYPAELILLVATTAATIILAFLRKKPAVWPFVFITLVSAYLAVSAVRFVIIFAVLVTYFWSIILPEIHLPAWRWKWVLEPIGIGILIVLISVDLWFLHWFLMPTPLSDLPKTWDQLCAFSLDCSEGIAREMRAHPPHGNGYHPYNFGGFLTWRVPQVKTFIDGRMAAWEENGKTPPVVAGDWVVLQKNPVTFREFDSQYHFQWAIVPTPSYIAGYLDDLVKNNLWTRPYHDQYYSYYVKRGAL